MCRNHVGQEGKKEDDRVGGKLGDGEMTDIEYTRMLQREAISKPCLHKNL